MPKRKNQTLVDSDSSDNASESGSDLESVWIFPQIIYKQWKWIMSSAWPISPDILIHDFSMISK